MTLPAAVSALLAARRIETVPADRLSARQRIARARDRLDTATKISTIDSEVAYVTAYDAARIAISAHMLAAGLRVRAANGAHEATGIYAEAMIADPSVREFQRMRRRATRPNTTTSSSASPMFKPTSFTSRRLSKRSARCCSN